MYKEEVSDCTSIKARFHQYFIHGESIDCTQWKRDYENCCRYEDTKDIKFGEELIKSETIRRINRMKSHYLNTTWKKRKNPPEDWNKPLPEWMEKDFESSYLNIKSKEMRGEVTPTPDIPNSFCVIM